MSLSKPAGVVSEEFEKICTEHFAGYISCCCIYTEAFLVCLVPNECVSSKKAALSVCHSCLLAMKCPFEYLPHYQDISLQVSLS